MPDVSLNGIEFEIKGRISNNLEFSSNYSYLKMKNPVLAAPGSMFNVTLLYSLGKFRFSAGVQSIADLYLTLAANPLIESYTVLNASAFYSNKIKKLGYTIFLKGDNLTGANYSINWGFPMPGAVISAGVSFDI
jgi:iron complex outermembrane receptor protein